MDGIVHADDLVRMTGLPESRCAEILRLAYKIIADKKAPPSPAPAITKGELLLAARLLNMASDEFGNHDFELPDTPDNRAMIARMAVYNDPNCDEDEKEPHVHDGKILTQDYFLMGYLSHKLKEAGIF